MHGAICVPQPYGPIVYRPQTTDHKPQPLRHALYTPCRRRNHLQNRARAIVELDLVLFHEPDGLRILLAEPSSAEMTISDQNGFPQRLVCAQTKIFEGMIDQITNRITGGVRQHRRVPIGVQNGGECGDKTQNTDRQSYTSTKKAISSTYFVSFRASCPILTFMPANAECIGNLKSPSQPTDNDPPCRTTTLSRRKPNRKSATPENPSSPHPPNPYFVLATHHPLLATRCSLFVTASLLPRIRKFNSSTPNANAIAK